jgi:hypothetical protein
MSLVGLGATGCALATRGAPSPPTTAALEQAEGRGRADVAAELRAGLAGRQTFGSVAPYVPVVLAPEVRRVWVPTHENAEGELVSGHWVYVRFTDFRWFTEAPVGRLGLGDRPAPIPDDDLPPPWPPGSSTTVPAVPWSEGAPPAPAEPVAPSSTGPSSEVPWTPGLAAPRATPPAAGAPRVAPTTPTVTPPGR